MLVLSTKLSFYSRGDEWNIDRKTLEGGWKDRKMTTCTISDLNKDR